MSVILQALALIPTESIENLTARAEVSVYRRKGDAR